MVNKEQNSIYLGWWGLTGRWASQLTTALVILCFVINSWFLDISSAIISHTKWRITLLWWWGLYIRKKVINKQQLVFLKNKKINMTNQSSITYITNWMFHVWINRIPFNVGSIQTLPVIKDIARGLPIHDEFHFCKTLHHPYLSVFQQVWLAATSGFSQS